MSILGMCLTNLITYVFLNIRPQGAGGESAYCVDVSVLNATIV